MTSLQAWLGKPRANVHIDRTLPWAKWMKVLRTSFSGKYADQRTRIEVLDRLSLGGKKSLLLISIEGRRLLVGVGEDAAPSISTFEGPRGLSSSRLASRGRRTLRSARRVR